MKKEFVLFVAILCFASTVFAEISLSEPDDIYNLGDRLYVTAYGLRGSDSGNLNIDLVCNGNSTSLLKISSRAFSFDEDQSYSIPYKILTADDLEIDNLDSIVGSCQVIASMGSEFISTKSFTISDEVEIEGSLNKDAYDPAEEISLSVSANKPNGNSLNGFFEVFGSVSASGEIVDGVAETSFSMPETAEAGNYVLNLRVYDVDEKGNVLNEAWKNVTFRVNQVVSFIETSLSGTEILPGNTFSIGEDAYDQSGKLIEGIVSVRILNEEDEALFVKTISSGSVEDFGLANNISAGIWRIESTFGDFVREDEVRVVELMKADFVVEDSVLTITNTGNVVYNKTINVQIGEDTKELNLKIGVGESRKFSLGAPDGEYDIYIGDGENSFQNMVALTGNAISVKDLESVGIFKNYSIVWIFLVLILASAGAVFTIRYRKKKNLGILMEEKPSKIEEIKGKVHSKMPSIVKSKVSDSLNFTTKSPAVQGLDSDNYSHEDGSLVDLTKKGVSLAESSLVLKGEKGKSAVICLGIKNYNSLGDNARQEIMKILSGTKAEKGLVDWRGNHVFVVFSPLVTKTYNNEILASKEAMRIAKELGDYNRKFRDKVEFSVGINVGDLVSSKQGGKLKYTSIGNTISFSQRLADSDVGKILISDEVRKKLLRDVKVKKDKKIGEKDVYEIYELKDREANEAKLKDLLKRM